MMTLNVPRNESYQKDRIATLALVAFGLSALPPLVHGAEEISFDGVQYVSGHFQPVQLEPNHTYLLMKEWRAIHVSKDPSNIMNGIRVECTGFIDAKADGTFNSDGYCGSGMGGAAHLSGGYQYGQKHAADTLSPTRATRSGFEAL
jgi:hypothetical protein